MSGPMWCDGCRAVGAIHCAHPDECGNMLSATAAADQWKAWLDDLPLPSIFDPAIGRLQDFITALTTRIDVPQPANEADRDRLAAANAALESKLAADADLLFDSYKALRVLSHVLSKVKLDAGVKAADAIAERIVAAHPEMPGRASLRAALAEVQADARREGGE